MSETEMSRTDAVKELRRRTNLGVKECNQALDDAEGDLETATAVLRERGIDVAMNKMAKGREMSEGVIEVYQHFTKQMTAMVEVNCETDFVAGTERFRKFAQDVARWIIMTGATTVEELMSSTIMHGTWDDNTSSVEQKLLELVAEVGESIQIRRFHVYKVGE